MIEDLAHDLDEDRLLLMEEMYNACKLNFKDDVTSAETDIVRTDQGTCKVVIRFDLCSIVCKEFDMMTSLGVLETYQEQVHKTLIYIMQQYAHDLDCDKCGRDVPFRYRIKMATSLAHSRRPQVLEELIKGVELHESIQRSIITPVEEEMTPLSMTALRESLRKPGEPFIFYRDLKPGVN